MQPTSSKTAQNEAVDFGYRVSVCHVDIASGLLYVAARRNRRWPLYTIGPEPILRVADVLGRQADSWPACYAGGRSHHAMLRWPYIVVQQTCHHHELAIRSPVNFSI
jgi:hypothetical protein